MSVPFNTTLRCPLRLVSAQAPSNWTHHALTDEHVFTFQHIAVIRPTTQEQTNVSPNSRPRRGRNPLDIDVACCQQALRKHRRHDQVVMARTPSPVEHCDRSSVLRAGAGRAAMRHPVGWHGPEGLRSTMMHLRLLHRWVPRGGRQIKPQRNKIRRQAVVISTQVLT